MFTIYIGMLLAAGGMASERDANCTSIIAVSAGENSYIGQHNSNGKSGTVLLSRTPALERSIPTEKTPEIPAGKMQERYPAWLSPGCTRPETPRRKDFPLA